jgi:hypothetical protein
MAVAESKPCLTLMVHGESKDSSVKLRRIQVDEVSGEELVSTEQPKGCNVFDSENELRMIHQVIDSKSASRLHKQSFQCAQYTHFNDSTNRR